MSNREEELFNDCSISLNKVIKKLDSINEFNGSNLEEIQSLILDAKTSISNFEFNFGKVDVIEVFSHALSKIERNVKESSKHLLDCI